MDEANITLGKPEIGKAHPTYNTVEVFVPFEGEIPDQWLEIFKAGPGGSTFSTNMPEMQLFVESGRSGITFACEPSAIGRNVGHVQSRTDGANYEYNTQYLPQLLAKLDREKKQREEDAATEQRLLEEAKKAVEDL